jgi:hypothetical protein
VRSEERHLALVEAQELEHAAAQQQQQHDRCTQDGQQQQQQQMKEKKQIRLVCSVQGDNAHMACASSSHRSREQDLRRICSASGKQLTSEEGYPCRRMLNIM